METTVPRKNEAFSAASYTAHYKNCPNAALYKACPSAMMVRIAPHQYVNDTFLKTSRGGLLAARHGVEFTNGDESGVKLKAKGKRKSLAVPSRQGPRKSAGARRG